MELSFNESTIKQVVRIKKIEFANFRNIGKGSISFPNSEYDDIQEGAPSILGLYGQNGSGKTSVVIALSVLKKLLSGQSISKGFSSCIRHGFDRCSLSFTLGSYNYVCLESQEIDATTSKTDITYSFDLTSTPNSILAPNMKSRLKDRVFVENEIVQIRTTSKDGSIITPKQVLLDTTVKNSNAKGLAFGNATKYSQLVGDDSKVKDKLLKLKMRKYVNSKSFIFSQELLSIVCNDALLENYSQLLDAYARTLAFLAAISEDKNETVQSLIHGLDFLKDKSIPSNSEFLTRISQLIATEYSADSESEQDELDRELFNALMSIICAEDEVLAKINPIHKKCTFAKIYSQEEINMNDVISDEFVDKALLALLNRFRTIYSYCLRINYGSFLRILKMYGLYCLHIIDTSITGQTNMNAMLPLLLWGSKQVDNQIQIDSECINLNMDDKTGVPEKKFAIVEHSIRAINLVLSELLPEMQLCLDDLGFEVDADGVNKHYFEIQSVRNETRIPLKYESDGVRRIVSLTSLFIAVYNEPSFTMAIDEIDSGIFEYLLGELFQILAENAQGQFIFTSHNLRPLEVLPAKYLCFTSTNPDKRFVKLRNRGNCNLRDTYFRTIILGSENEMVYQPTDRYRIQRAFYNAGHGGDSR